MSLVFWGLAAGMVALAVALITLPWWWRRRTAPGNPSAEQVDVAVYRQRRVELDRERDAGLLTARDHRVALVELDRQLLADTEDADARATASAGRRGVSWPVAAVVLAVPLLAVSLYLQIGGGAATRHETPQAAAGQHDINAMVQRLQQRLDTHPDDGKGWLMLGRSYAVLNRPKQAVNALSRARRLLGDTPAVLLEYARALAMARPQASFAGRPAKLLEQALKKAPDNGEALWLSGMAAAERGDYQTTVSRWQKLLAQLPPDSEDANSVRRNLQAVQQRVAESGAVPAPSAPDTGPASPAPAHAVLKVNVSLSPKLQQQAAAADTVFIFARAAHGSPMPVAVVRRQVRDLPATITLDDSDARMPGATLSSQKQVTVVARVAKSGGAMARSGDLESSPQTVTVADGGSLSLTIDSVVP